MDAKELKKFKRLRRGDLSLAGGYEGQKKQAKKVAWITFGILVVLIIFAVLPFYFPFKGDIYFSFFSSLFCIADLFVLVFSICVFSIYFIFDSKFKELDKKRKMECLRAAKDLYWRLELLGLEVVSGRGVTETDDRSDYAVLICFYGDEDTSDWDLPQRKDGFDVKYKYLDKKDILVF